MSDSTKTFVSIQVPAAKVTKALTTLRSYGVQTKEAELVDISKALVSLRSYGLTEKEAQATIDVESLLVTDYDRQDQKSLAPELIEIFGYQHISDALSYTYLYLDDFKVLWTEYQKVLYTLLRVYRPEELITSPELIRYFMNKLTIKDERIVTCITDLQNEAIIKMASNSKYCAE